MVFSPTLGDKRPHSRGNVGKYSIQGSYGQEQFTKKNMIQQYLHDLQVRRCSSQTLGHFKV